LLALLPLPPRLQESTIVYSNNLPTINVRLDVLRMLTALLLFPVVLTAASRFVQPLEGSQAIGRQQLEVRTDSQALDRVEFRVDGVLVGVVRKPPLSISFDFGDELRIRKVDATLISKGFTFRETISVRTAGVSINDAIDVDLVEVPLRIRGRNKISSDHLKISEDGVRQTIRSVERVRAAAKFHFIVDRSLSMKGEKLENSVAAVHDALARLKKNDHASVVTFNHVIDPPVVAASFRKATPSGGTSLRDAVSSVDTTSKSYIVVITDGGDRNSRASSEETLKKIATSNSSIYAITLGSGEGTRFVEGAASATGGLSLEATGATIRTAMKQIVDDIDSRYVVTYQSTSRKKGWRSIRIDAPSLAVNGARKGYYTR